MKRMFTFYAVLLLTIQSCSPDDTKVTPQPEWEKIEFADQGAIYSIYGDLENTMLLGTSRSIIKLTDNGKVIHQVLLNETIIGFRKENDTLFAASNPKNYYSIDNGDTWHASDKGFEPYHTKELRDSKGILYHHVALPNGELITPSLILKSSDNGTNWENIFPYKHFVYSIYLDSKDRLFLGINGWEWDGKSFVVTGNTAILYYQKK